MKIFKYVLPFPASSLQGRVTVPKYAKLLKVGVQGSDICAWLQVDEEEKELSYLRYIIVGTGWSIINHLELPYLDTIFVDQFVWHVYGEIK